MFRHRSISPIRHLSNPFGPVCPSCRQFFAPVVFSIFRFCTKFLPIVVCRLYGTNTIGQAICITGHIRSTYKIAGEIGKFVIAFLILLKLTGWILPQLPDRFQFSLPAHSIPEHSCPSDRIRIWPSRAIPNWVLSHCCAQWLTDSGNMSDRKVQEIYGHRHIWQRYLAHSLWENSFIRPPGSKSLECW